MTGLKLTLLDLFCGAGGAATGYHKAGFAKIVGVDIAPQKHYPFEFVLADALEYVVDHGRKFDLIHASPPCQGYSATKSMPWVPDYPLLIAGLRNLLQETGKPYVIENVPGAPLNLPILLCGLMFGMKIIRHRLFETNPYMLGPFHSDHPPDVVTNSFRSYSSFDTGATHISMTGHNFSAKDAVAAMNGNCSWMTREEIAECVPPPYTEYIGKILLATISNGSP